MARTTRPDCRTPTSIAAINGPAAGVGLAWALTCDLAKLDAHRAQELGLVHEVVPHERLLPATEEWCAKIAALPAHAIAMTKPLLRAAADGTWESTLAMEEFAEPQCFTTDAFQENVRELLVER